jgi:hypothetical protein
MYEFIPVTDLQVGDVLSGDVPVTALRPTAKRVYITFRNSEGESVEFYESKTVRVAIRPRTATA